jgi:MFS family permease
VVVIALLAGIAYGFVAIPAQTQLQEDLPEDVRGRVFGVLNMLVSVASFVPIIIVGPISDTFGTTAVIITVAFSIFVVGVVSVLKRGPLSATQVSPAADPHIVDPIAHALGADLPTWHDPEMPTERYVASAGAATAAAAATTAAATDPPPPPDPPAPAAPADPD